MHNLSTLAIIVDMGGGTFLLHPEANSMIPSAKRSQRYVAATVIHWNGDIFDNGDAERVSKEFLAVDDVWNFDFLTAIILCASNNVDVRCTREYDVIVHGNTTGNLPQGPYIVDSSSGAVHSIWKLIEDTSEAFVGGVLSDPISEEKYTWLRGTSIAKHIAIPSRLYYGARNSERPLCGMRFAVKDVIDIKGLETACGSKCFGSLYPPKLSTAPFIRKLVRAGAVLVGKLRCTQFCDGQDPLERFEEVTPTNPRGDGFQKPSSSSSGSASACASYSWLDFTIGTDTGGSTRHPAGVNGIYGLRPSLNAVTSQGLVLTPLFDSVGVFARSAAMTEVVATCMLDEPSRLDDFDMNKVRFKLLYAVEPDSSELSNTPKFFQRREGEGGFVSDAAHIFERVIQALEKYLKCQRQQICLEELWRQTHPDGEPDDLTEATGKLYRDIVYGTLYSDVIKPFVTEYRTKNSGRNPFIEPITKARLEYGAKVNQTELEASLRASKSYGGWIRDVLFGSSPSISSSADTQNEIPLLVFPQSWGVPQYRDESDRSRNKSILWNGFSVYSISYCSGCPDITVPVGQVKFQSKITETEGQLPVSLSFLTEPGSDVVLLSLLRKMEQDGLLKPVQTGTTTFLAE